MTAAVPRVSMFMASYNGAAYVEAAVRSILDQTVRDLECIVVDDGSNAPTLDILRRLAASDARMRLVENAHLGQIGTLNYALSLCRGAFVGRLDHDDIALPDRLARQLTYLESHPDVAAVGGELEFVDADGNSIAQKRADPLKRLRYQPLAFPPKQVFLSGSTVLARKTAWDRTGGFRTEFAAAEDRDICWLLAAQGPVVRLPASVVRYRVHASNMSLLARRTQLYSQFLCSLSAVAAALGRDDTEIRKAIVPGGDYSGAIEDYRVLLDGVYPVETYRLFFLARMRMWTLGNYADGAALSRAITAHWREKPFSPARLRTLWTAWRYTRRKVAVAD